MQMKGNLEFIVVRGERKEKRSNNAYVNGATGLAYLSQAHPVEEFFPSSEVDLL